MRTALCLYGQPRNIKENWNHIFENTVKPNNADIFLHTWFDPKDLRLHKMTPGHESKMVDPETINFCKNLPNLVSFDIEEQIEFNPKIVSTTEENIEACWPWSRVYDRDTFIRDRVKCGYSMWYSIYKSIMMKEIYSQTMGFEYDCVILSRFDVSPRKIVKINEFDLEKLNSGYQKLPRDEVNDWYMFANNIIFLTIDFHRNKIIEKNAIWTNEAYLRDQLKIFGIEVDYNDLQITF